MRCATSQTFPGSIPGGVTGFFNDIFLPTVPMALGSTQPLVKTSNRNISWGGKDGRLREADLTTFMWPMLWKSGSLNLLEPSRSHQACYGNSLAFLPLPLPPPPQQAFKSYRNPLSFSFNWCFIARKWNCEALQ